MRRQGEEMAAKLLTSREKKNKDKAKPSTSKVVDNVREGLSYLSLAATVLGLGLHNVPLETDARVPL